MFKFTKFRSFILAVVLLAVGSPTAFAQTAVQTTTLSSALNGTAVTLQVASATGFAVGQPIMVDREVLNTVAISGTAIRVVRGVYGSEARAHVSGRVVYTAPPGAFVYATPTGTCLTSDQPFTPMINAKTAELFNCSLINATIREWQVAPKDFFDPVLNRAAVSDANYTVGIGDVYIGYRTLTTTRTVTLPAFTGQPPRILIIQDESNSATTLIAITVSGTINGTTTLNFITAGYGTLRLIWTGTAWIKW